MNPMVEIKGISKSFGRTHALSAIDLTIEEGQFFALVGPSGSGKSTLLHILGGFVRPDGGQILIGGQDVSSHPPARRPTTSMFQDYALFPHMSVGANVGFGLLMRKVPKSQRMPRIERALDMVGLSGMSARRIHQLSGGQQQRVALARALVVEPKVLLLDEPLGALDLNLRRQMQQELLHIQKKVGTTFVHVTHDQEEAMSVADVITVMNNGRIEDVGPPARVYLKPKTLFAATFMGETNILEGRIVAKSGPLSEIETAVGRLALPVDHDSATNVKLSIRPEQIMAGDQNSSRHLTIGRLKVREVTFFGTHRRCQGELLDSALSITFRSAQNQAVQVGDELAISMVRDDIVVLAG